MNAEDDNVVGGAAPTATLMASLRGGAATLAASLSEGREKSGTEPQEEEEEGVDSSVLSQPPYIAPPELHLTKQDEKWTWDLVTWIELHGDEEGISKPTDFEFVLYALSTKGNTEEAVERLRGIQEFKKTYNIQDTVEEGMQAIRDIIQLQPGFLLHLDCVSSSGAASLADAGVGAAEQPGVGFAVDMSKLVPARVRSSVENYRKYVVFLYYLFHVVCVPNFDSLRGGSHFMIESAGASHRNMDVFLERRVHRELISKLHVTCKQNRIFNTSPAVTSFFDLIRSFLSTELRDTIKVGCQIELTEREGQPFEFLFGEPNFPRLTLPDLYLRPSYDVAMEKLLTKAETLLEEYYHNLGTFEF